MFMSILLAIKEILVRCRSPYCIWLQILVPFAFLFLIRYSWEELKCHDREPNVYDYLPPGIVPLQHRVTAVVGVDDKSLENYLKSDSINGPKAKAMELCGFRRDSKQERITVDFLFDDEKSVLKAIQSSETMYKLNLLSALYITCPEEVDSMRLRRKTNIHPMVAVLIKHKEATVSGIPNLNDSIEIQYGVKQDIEDDYNYFQYVHAIHEELLDQIYWYYFSQADKSGVPSSSKALAVLKMKEKVSKAPKIKLKDPLQTWAIVVFLLQLFPMVVLLNRVMMEKIFRVRDLFTMFDYLHLQYYISFVLVDFAWLMVINLDFAWVFGGFNSDAMIALVMYSLTNVLFTLAFSVFFKDQPNATGFYIFTGFFTVALFHFCQKGVTFRKHFLSIPQIWIPEWIHFVLCIFLPPFYGLETLMTLSEESKMVEHTCAFYDYVDVQKRTFLTFSLITLAMSLSCIFWLSLLFYVGNIWPWQIGQPKPFWFPLKFCSPTDKREFKESSSKYFEPTKVGQEKAGIEINNVNIGKKKQGPYLKDINFRIYPNQITCLLGPKQSGKSTLMDIVGGVLYPDSGQVLIDGHVSKLRTALSRHNLGYVPQKESLFDQLNVIEHLYLFVLLKQYPCITFKPEIYKMIKLFNLRGAEFIKVKNLPKTVKRKLQIAIAAIAQTKFLILDEPTADLDVGTRNEIWRALKHLKSTTLIFFSTTDLVEAEQLADRVVVLQESQMKVVGSIPFMKRVLKVGYHIRVIKGKNFANDRVLKLLRGQLKSLYVTDEDASEVLYSFKKEDATKLWKVWEEMQKNAQNFGIENFYVIPKTEVVHVLSQGKPVKVETLRLDSKVSLKVTSLMIKFKALLRKRYCVLLQKMTLFRGSLLYVSILGLLIIFSQVNEVVYTVNKALNRYPLDFRNESALFSCKGSIEKCDAFANGTSKAGLLLFANENQFKVEIVSHKDINCITVNTSKDFGAKGVTAAYNGLLSLFHSLVDHQQPYFGKITGVAKSRSFIIVESSPQVGPSPLSARKRSTLRMYTFGALLSAGLNILPFWMAATEHLTKFKKLQLMTGVSAFLYWSSQLLFDLLLVCSLLVPFVIVLQTLYFFDYSVLYCEFSTLVVFYSLMGLLIANGVLSSYILTLLVGSIGVGLAFMVTTNFVGAFGKTYLEDFIVLPKFLHYFCQLVAFVFPSTQFGTLFAVLDRRTLRHELCEDLSPLWKICTESDSKECHILETFCTTGLTAGESSELLYLAAALLLSVALYFMILICVEELPPWLRKQRMSFPWNEPPIEMAIEHEETTDVSKEHIRAEDIFLSRPAANRGLIAIHVSNREGPFRIQQLSFAIGPKECFCLFGTFGSGKTLTVQSIIGEIYPLHGDIFINECTLSRDIRKFRSQIGYSPQRDCLPLKMTGEETLRLFATLRGIPSEAITKAVSEMITFVDLQVSTELISSYNPVNKKKLSLAIAFIGWPPVIVLDEPMTIEGLHKASIRGMIRKILQTQNSAIFFTCRTLADIEGLPSKVAVISEGQFCFVSTLQKLRAKLNRVVEISIRFKSSNNSQDPQTILDEFTQKIPTIMVESIDSQMLRVEISYPPSSRTLSTLYQTMEALKAKYDLAEYEIFEKDLDESLVRTTVLL